MALETGKYSLLLTRDGFVRCLDNWWLLRRVRTTDYLLEMALEVSRRSVALETGYDN